MVSRADVGWDGCKLSGHGADVGWGGCSRLTNGGGFRARRPYAVLSGILLVRHERTCPAKSSSCPDSNERLVWKASGYPSLKSSVTRKPPISRVQEMGGGSIARPFLLGLLLEMPAKLPITAGLFALRGIAKTPGAAHYPSSACRTLAKNRRYSFCAWASAASISASCLSSSSSSRGDSM